MRRLKYAKEIEHSYQSREDVEGHIYEIGRFFEQIQTIQQYLSDQKRNAQDVNSLTDDIVEDYENQLKYVLYEDYWDDYSWDIFKKALLSSVPTSNKYVETIDIYIKRMDVNAIKSRAATDGTSWRHPFYFLLGELDKFASIIKYNLEILSKVLNRIKNDMIDHVEKTVLKKKYPLKDLSKEEFIQVFSAMYDMEKYGDYVYKDVNKTWNQLMKLSQMCDKLVKQLSNISGIELDIQTFFHPSPFVDGSTSSGQAAAFWDPQDHSINFTIASSTYKDKTPKLELDIDTDYVESLVLHEAGHMIDTKLGDPSNTPEFQSLLVAIDFNPSTQQKYKEYYEYGKKAEAFADLMVHWAMGEKLNKAHYKLEYNREENQLINEYFTSLIDGTPFAQLEEGHDEYDEDGNVKPEIQEVRNREKTSRLKKANIQVFRFTNFDKRLFDMAWRDKKFPSIKEWSHEYREIIWNKLLDIGNTVKSKSEEIARQFSIPAPPIYLMIEPGEKLIMAAMSKGYLALNIPNVIQFDTNYIMEDTVHEMGHFIDMAFNRASHSEDFRRLLQMIEFDRTVYNGRYEGREQIEEAFADLFIAWYLGKRIGIKEEHWRKIKYDHTAKDLVNEYYTALLEDRMLFVEDENHKLIVNV